MSIADWTGFAKLTLDLASFYMTASKFDRNHTLTVSKLIDLHDTLTQLRKASVEYHETLLRPSLHVVDSSIEHKWTRACDTVVNVLNDIDLAAVRVYSPELADVISEDLTAMEARASDCSLDVNTAWQAEPQGMQELHEKLVAMSNYSTVTPVIIGFGQTNMSDVIAAIDLTTAELEKFIKTYWPTPK